MSILEYFPTDALPCPRQGQISVINEVESAINAGYKYILIEAPVGSGKSGIAMTIARWAKSAHILTPQKALQNQYYEDFHAHSVMMKGRSSYPCVFFETPADAKAIRDKVATGGALQIYRGHRHCGQGPCKDSEENYLKCTGWDGDTELTPCPYTLAIETAQAEPIVIHNLHSYIYQTHFGGRFLPRKVMIIDEAHRIETILRDFAKFSMTLPGLLCSDEEKWKWGRCEAIADWVNYFCQTRFLPKDEEEKKKYIDKVTKLESLVQEFPTMWKNFAMDVEELEQIGATRFELTPEKLGALPQALLYSGGEINILMSGTIYDKVMFCKDRGLDYNSVYFIRISSTFPLESRPVIMKDEYMVDTSHKEWASNLREIAEKVRKVLGVFKDVKGLIHVPSYRAADELLAAVGDTRLMTHTSEDSAQRLEEFYRRDDNAVYVSPTCMEGVDFKYDRARFQIVTRVPYLNTGDPFVGMKVDKDFEWYNYQALINFGQILGRVNRGEKDFGVTVLLDSRFPKFIRKNKRKLPKWQLDAIRSK